MFDGPDPQIVLVDDENEEIERVAGYLKVCLSEGMEPNDLAILVRSRSQFGRARAAANSAGLDHEAADGITITAMHDAKGLEFRGVAVMACDDDVIPDGERINDTDVDGFPLDHPDAQAKWDEAQTKRIEAARIGAALRPKMNLAASVIAQNRDYIQTRLAGGAKASEVCASLNARRIAAGTKPVGRSEFYKHLRVSGLWD